MKLFISIAIAILLLMGCERKQCPAPNTVFRCWDYDHPLSDGRFLRQTACRCVPRKIA